MKKLLPLLLLSSILISLNSFGKTVCVATDTQNRDGVVYLPNETEGFTGVNLCKYKDGQVWRKGNYIDGILDKKTEYLYYDNGQIKMESNWTYDTLDGKFKQDGKTTDWYANGQIWSEANYKNGGLEGKTYFWNESGQLKSHGSYKNNKRDGISHWYFDNGKKRLTVNYKASMTVSSISWYENGKLKSKSKWKDNITLEGWATRWYENGQKSVEGNYKDHKKVGRWTFWNENGQIEARVVFKNGECTGEDCPDVDSTLN